MRRYRTTGTSASQNTCYTFSLLLDLMQFFDYYHGGQLEVALDVRIAYTDLRKGYYYTWI